MKKFIFFLWVIILSFPFYAASADTTTTTPEEERLRKEETAREFERLKPPLPPPEKLFSLKTGGWFTATLRDYKNTDNNASAEDTISSTFLNELRLWMLLTYHQNHQLYLRVKNSYIQRNTGLGYTGIGDDFEGPGLDTGYIKLNFKAFNDIPYDFILGRQYLYIGRGISYSDINDGLKFDFKPKNIYLKSFLAHTLPNEDNVDTSVPNYEKEGDRLFWGTEAAYLGFKNTTVYTYGLIQRDKTDKNPIPTQNFRYDSEYYGLGLQGFLKKNLNYWLEAIKENGSSFTDTASVGLEKKDINAWALDLGTRYDAEIFLHPGCEIEYAFATGDKDRSSVTDTKNGGNKFGQDQNFSYFGSFFSGYALSPRLSNLRVYKLDLYLKPFEELALTNIKDISWGVKYFLYRKDKTGGGIYDTDATQADKDVGQEFDTYLYWQVSKNFYLSFRYGIFYPGEAYPKNTNNNTKYFSARLMATF